MSQSHDGVVGARGDAGDLYPPDLGVGGLPAGVEHYTNSSSLANIESASGQLLRGPPRGRRAGQILLDIQNRILYPSLMQKQVLIRRVLINLGLIQDDGIFRCVLSEFTEKELSA